MRLLIDANLSHRVAELLREAGHDAVHVREIGLQHASDAAILNAAMAGEQVIVSEDTDFGALLARRQASGPSLVLLRSRAAHAAAAGNAVDGEPADGREASC